MFGRIIFNENANNNAYRAVPQDAHDFGRPEGVRGFSRILVRIKSLSRQVSEKGLFQVFFVFLLVPVWDVYYQLSIFIFLNTVAPTVQKDCFLGRQWI